MYCPCRGSSFPGHRCRTREELFIISTFDASMTRPAPSLSSDRGAMLQNSIRNWKGGPGAKPPILQPPSVTPGGAGLARWQRAMRGGVLSSARDPALRGSTAAESGPGPRMPRACNVAQLGERISDPPQAAVPAACKRPLRPCAKGPFVDLPSLRAPSRDRWPPRIGDHCCPNSPENSRICPLTCSEH